jgi:hypothetical protein
MWDRNHTNVWFVGTGGSHFCVVLRPSLQIAAIGGGSRFGGHSGRSQQSIALQAASRLRPESLNPRFHYKKRVRPAADVG